jgi:hypothetical protein
MAEGQSTVRKLSNLATNNIVKPQDQTSGTEWVRPGARYVQSSFIWPQLCGLQMSS